MLRDLMLATKGTNHDLSDQRRTTGSRQGPAGIGVVVNICIFDLLVRSSSGSSSRPS